MRWARVDDLGGSRGFGTDALIYSTQCPAVGKDQLSDQMLVLNRVQVVTSAWCIFLVYRFFAATFVFQAGLLSILM